MSVISDGTKRFMKNFVSNKVLGKSYPFFGSIETTRRCNSRCAFCPIGNEKKEIKEGEMGTKDMKRVFDQFNELNILAVSFLGGEPFLRKDVFEIARYSGELGIISQVSTNGLTLPSTYEEATSSFDVIVISLDTLNPELYKDIRGVDAYDTVIDGLNKSLKVADKNKCNMILNTVVCAKNIPDVPDVVRYAKEIGVKGIMIDFATFHEYWVETSGEKSRYDPEGMDWKQKKPEVKELVKELLKMKKSGYPIITSNSYLKTFITEDFHYDCYPYIFCCVRKDGRVAIPCWDSKVTEYYDILHKHNLKELWFSEEVEEKRKQVADCRDCYMHCIVEPSKILGAPSRNMIDLMEWIATFRKNKF